MNRREKPRSRQGPINVLLCFTVCMTLGRLIFILRPERKFHSPVRPVVHRMTPDLLPGPQQQKGHRTAPGLTQWERHHLKATVPDTAYVAGRRGEAMPTEMYRFSTRRGTEDGHHVSREDPGHPVGSGRNGDYGDSRGVMNGLERGRPHWGEGMRVLIFTMDSLAKTVAKSNQGGAAGEIIVRESLTMALREAGVKVEVATSDLDFERRADIMDIYNAVVLDPWTWAGKGWRIKPQLAGRQHKVFVLDFFGSEEPHANMGVPVAQHLTAFPVPASQQRAFLGYRADDVSQTELSGGKTVTRRRQGVIWGKTPAYFRRESTRRLISSLADIVELHSTIAPENAPVAHDNIVYHGHLSREKWRSLLRESKFIVGLGDPLSGPSAVDAVMAGCVYLNPVFTFPMKKIYNSQHPFLAQNVGEPYVCSFEEGNTKAALACSYRALEKDLPPMVPDAFTKEAHATRVKRIFEPVMMASQQRLTSTHRW